MVCSSSPDCTRRRPRLASWRTAADERPITEPTSSKGTANRSCSTKASRSAGESVSRTTCSAVPTWSARTASCTGSASSVGQVGVGVVLGQRVLAPAAAAAQLVEADPARRRWSARRRGSPPRTRRCARAAARPPARRRRPRAPSRASGRPPRAGGCAAPRTPPRAAPGPRGPSWSPCPVDVRRGSGVTSELPGSAGANVDWHDPCRAPHRRLRAHRQDRHRRGRRPHRRPARRPPGARGELDRLAGLAPGPGPGRPRRRRGRHRAGVDRAGLRDPLRPAVRLRARPATA